MRQIMVKKLYRYAFILIIFILFISMISCNNTITQKEESVKESYDDKSLVANEPLEEADTVKLNEETTVESDDQSIEVDKGIFSVEITLPASFFEGEDIGGIANEVEDKDIKIIKNSDGSVTYKMSKSKHNELMKELNMNLIEQIEEIKNSEDYKSIEDITYNKTFSELTLIVDQEKFESSFDGIAVFGLGLMSMYYQLFSGINPEDYRVVINYENADTGEIFGNVVYPDAFED